MVFVFRKIRNIQWDDCAKYNSLWIAITLHGWLDFFLIPLIPIWVYNLLTCWTKCAWTGSTQFCWTVRSLAINVIRVKLCKIPRLRKETKRKISNKTFWFNGPSWSQCRLCCARMRNCLCNNIGEFSFNGGLRLNTGSDLTAVPLSSLYVYHLLPLLAKHRAFPLLVDIIQKNSPRWYSLVILLT